MPASRRNDWSQLITPSWRFDKTGSLLDPAMSTPCRVLPHYGLRPTGPTAEFLIAKAEGEVEFRTQAHAVAAHPLHQGARNSRIRHVIHLGVATRGYSFAVNGRKQPSDPVHLSLWVPDGTTWQWGPESAT